jgi:hypothetical protein
VTSDKTGRDQGHSAILENPTIAGALLDRLVHNAYRIALDGPSPRKTGAGNGRDIRAEVAK